MVSARMADDCQVTIQADTYHVHVDHLLDDDQRRLFAVVVVSAVAADPPQLGLRFVYNLNINVDYVSIIRPPNQKSWLSDTRRATDLPLMDDADVINQ